MKETWRFAGFRLSVTVEFDGVDAGRNGASSVAAALLFRLFVSEGLAFGVLEHVVSPLAPISTRSHLGSEGVVCQAWV